LSLHQIILAGIIIFAAHFVAGVTGFGSGLLGLPLLALLVSLDVGKQSLFVLSTALYIYIVARWHEHINWKQLIIMMLIGGLGMPLGLYLARVVEPKHAILALGVFVGLVGLRNLLFPKLNRAMPRWIALVLLFIGGIVHGAFTTGGPLLIVYADQTIKHKSTFRSTLSLLWLALNLMLFVGWTWKHSWAAATPKLTLIGLPFLVAGLAAGEYAHHRIDERGFRRAVSVTLVIIGVLVVATAAG